MFLRGGFLAIDEQRSTRLLDLAMRHWQLDSLSASTEYANARPAPELLETGAALRLRCRRRRYRRPGSPHPGGVADLAYLATLVIMRIQSIEAGLSLISVAVPAVAITGSVLERVGILREAMQSNLRRLYPGITFIDQPPDPPLGALWGRARSRVGS